jgi:hypothetical protein
MFIRNDAPDTPANRRWRLWESLGVCAFLICLLITVLRDALSLSNRLVTTEDVKGLEASPWVAGLKVDLNDGQLRGFRGALPQLTAVAVLFICLRRKWTSSGGSQVQFYLASGLCLCLVLHGPGLLFLLLWAIVNWQLAQRYSGTRFYSLTTWTLNLAFLLVADYTNGFQFAWFGLKFLVTPT